MQVWVGLIRFYGKVKEEHNKQQVQDNNIMFHELDNNYIAHCKGDYNTI